MGHQTHAHSSSEHWGHTVPALGLVTERHRAALNALHRAFDQPQPLTLLVAEGKFEANHVVSAFLASLGDDATIIRLTRPYDDAVSGMREITRALGFEPKDLSLSDLDKILEMYLNFQRKHRRPTVLCIEQAHLQARWLLEHVKTMVELEARGHYRMMVILSGQAQLKGMMSDEPLQSIRRLAGAPIVLAPFTSAETTDFLRQRVAVSKKADISDLFEFAAINRIHELSGGVPDLVGTLAFKCLQIAGQQESGPVTDQLVIDAAKLLWQKPAVQAKVEVPDRQDIPDIGPESSFREVLSISLRDKPVKDVRLRKGRYLVGRAEFADIHLSDKHVSRRHALIVKKDAGISITDLGSTNGTFVNGLRFSGDQSLMIGDVIKVGEYRIEVSIT